MDTSTQFDILKNLDTAISMREKKDKRKASESSTSGEKAAAESHNEHTKLLIKIRDMCQGIYNEHMLGEERLLQSRRPTIPRETAEMAVGALNRIERADRERAELAERAERELAERELAERDRVERERKRAEDARRTTNMFKEPDSGSDDDDPMARLMGHLKPKPGGKRKSKRKRKNKRNTKKHV